MLCLTKSDTLLVQKPQEPPWTILQCLACLQQGKYHNQKLAKESTVIFQVMEDGKGVEGVYKDVIRLQQLENEEARVKKRREERGRVKMLQWSWWQLKRYQVLSASINGMAI